LSVSYGHKQATQTIPSTHTQCLAVVLYLDISSLCRGNEFSVVHEYDGVVVWKSFE